VGNTPEEAVVLLVGEDIHNHKEAVDPLGVGNRVVEGIL
jgi:hypothetical protein